MRDPEFIELRNKFLFGLFIVILFSIPILIFLVRTYGGSSVLHKVDNKETFVILVTSNECDKCNLVKNVLKDNQVKFSKLNGSSNKDYDEVMRKLGIENKRDEFPILIYVKDGKMYANLFSINTEKNVTDFLKFHGLNNYN